MSVRAASAWIGLILVLAACGGAATVDATSTTSVPSTSAPTDATSPTGAADGASIPLGTYVKVDTRDQLVAGGVDESLLNDVFGSADSVKYTFKINEDRWSQFFSVDGSPDELGDKGTYTYDEDRLWVTTSESEGASGTVIAFAWHLDGDTLTLRAVSGVSEADSLVLDGEYQKTG